MGTAPDGRAIYLPGTLPGERVTVTALTRRGQDWTGSAMDPTPPSTERVSPPCPHFGTCGGCVLQHWQMQPYLAWKSGLLAAALHRAGFADAEPGAIAQTGAGERRRFDLAVRRVAGGGVRIGLHQARSATVVDLAVCPVLHPDLARLLDPLRRVLDRVAALRREGSAIANLLDDGADLLLRLDAQPNAADRALLADFARAHGLPRIHCALGAGPGEPVCVLRPAVVTLSGMAVSPPPGGFLQASRAGEAALVAAVLAGLPAKRAPRARVAELFAGCGTFSFALARHVRVAAWEGDAAAVAALRQAAGQAGLAGRIEVELRDLFRQPIPAATLAKFAAVVMDPPHAGAAAQVAQIAASGVPTVVYVSCNPQSLARDASVLAAAGYGLVAATPIDQFLWSARLESVVVFAR